MKKFILTGLCCLILNGCSTENTVEETRNNVSSFQSIERTEFLSLAASGDFVVLDIRTPAELLPHNGGKLLEDAINIDFYDAKFRANLDQLDRNKKYLLYCRSGNRSGQTLKIMDSMGFGTVYDLQGGV